MQIKNWTAILGDCLVEMKAIQDESIDCIITDPPYWTTNCKWDTIISFDLMWEQVYRILRKNWFAIFTSSNPFSAKIISSNIENFSHQWIWEKVWSNGNPLLCNKMPLKNFEDVLVFSKEYKKYDYELKSPIREYSKKLFYRIGKTKKDIFIDMWNQSVDHFMRYDSMQFTIPSRRSYDELIKLYGIENYDFFITYSELTKINNDFYMSIDIPERVYNPQKTAWKPYIQKQWRLWEALWLSEWHVTINEWSRFPKSILRFWYDKDKHHPTQKPVALIEYLIKTYTNEWEIVLDFTAGSFTTAVACENTNRKWICIEKEQNYFDIWIERLCK